MRIFLVYLLAFIGISIIDALWHLVLFGKQYGEWLRPIGLLPRFFSELLIVSAIMFIVLYKTQGHPKLGEAVLMGSIAGILAISVNGLVNLTILEFIWGPILGALSGMLIALLAKKFL